MKASVRCVSLSLSGSGDKSLHGMEQHGKRLDGSSQKRKVRDVEPLVFGSLDLRLAFDAHKGEAKTNASLKRPILHFIMQFPDEIDADDPEKQKAMLKHAVRFINRSHGGDAVFAARLDRDEKGKHTVDVFAAPKYVKTTKAAETEWLSPTKFGKDLADKHQGAIQGRFPKAKGVLTGPRHVGIALQEELDIYFRGIGMELEPRKLKQYATSDRVDPETYKLREEARADRDRAAIELAAAQRLVADQQTIIQTSADAAARAVVSIITGDIQHQGNGKWMIPKDQREGLRPIWKTILPNLARISQWWDRVRGRIDDLSDPESQAILDEDLTRNDPGF